MRKSIVSVVRYENPLSSVRKAVELSCALEHLPDKGKVFIKPNIVYWNRKTGFPKWGVITTSRVVEDMVLLLKELGVEDITIGEGSVIDVKDTETPAHAFESLGYNILKKRYGVKLLNIFERPFRKVEVGSGIELNFNIDFLESDFVVNIPVMKTHSQTVVSLACKNLKGLLDIESRKRCHSIDLQKDLNHMISLLKNSLPPSMAILDGIFTNERGPMFGNIRRTNILVASRDTLSADMVGSKILGHSVQNVPHLRNSVVNAGRPSDLSDVEIVGENPDSVTCYHEYSVPYNEDGTLSLDIYGMGGRGLTCRNPGLTICTYCVGLPELMSTAIAFAWKGKEWNDVEILSGKTMKPTRGKKKTILLGKCMYLSNRDNHDIQDMYPVKSCPPDPQEVVRALHWAGIEVNPSIIEQPEILLKGLMNIYKDKPEFDESFFRIP